MMWAHYRKTFNVYHRMVNNFWIPVAKFWLSEQIVLFAVLLQQMNHRDQMPRLFCIYNSGRSLWSVSCPLKIFALDFIY